MTPPLVLESMLTCPACGATAIETMPTDACVYYYECRRCLSLLKPRPGDCCVYCSYASVPCPPMQQDACCSLPRDRPLGGGASIEPSKPRQDR